MMCQQLSNRFLAENIEFVDPDCDPDAEGGPRMINFKRVLLNKCQEEFEKGDSAIKAVEQEEIDDENEKKGEGDAKEEEKEEGEVPAKPKTPEELELDERRKIQQREDRMRQARRRMLGNIRFIGELFKKEMLTARIMHTCIMKLLNEKKNPDEEDVEALCKLMATIGRLIDRPDAKSHMDAYFKRIQGLSVNKSISSRHRFMCQDIMEMRSKGWRERRKQEGPKKIEDVHKDAAREAMNQARGGGPRGAAAPETSAAARPRTADEGTADAADATAAGAADATAEGLALASPRRFGQAPGDSRGCRRWRALAWVPAATSAGAAGGPACPSPAAAAAAGDPAGATRPGPTRAPLARHPG